MKWFPLTKWYERRQAKKALMADTEFLALIKQPEVVKIGRFRPIQIVDDSQWNQYVRNPQGVKK